MTGIFLSYSRADGDFVRRLYDELAKRAIEVWVDWEDIPPSAEWWRDISSAIEAADAVVFVISPESIASKVCQDELAHAVRHNKRLIPVVWSPVDPHAHQIPLSLARINWIFFRPEQERFTAACDQLVTAVSTDLEWVHAHSRILNRSIEWDQEGRDDSFLLRKNDLTQAEAWLVEAPGREPKPTALQMEYILASRRSATRGQRRISSAIAVLLLIAAVALWQRHLAEAQRNEAFSRRLAAQSLSTLDASPDLALLLAAEAHAAADTFEARNALLTGLDKTRGVIRFLPPKYRADAFDLSQDGHFAAVVERTTSRLQLLRVPDLAPLAHRDFHPPVLAVRFREKDGALGIFRCCFQGAGGRVEWLDVPSLVTRTEVRLPAARDPELPTFLGADWLYTGHTLHDTSTGEIAAALPVKGAWISVAVHPTAPVFLIVGMTEDGTKIARLWSWRTREEQVLPGDGEPGQLWAAAFDEDGSKMAAVGCTLSFSEGFCSQQGEVRIWRFTARGVESESDETQPEMVGALTFLPHSDLLVSGGCAAKPLDSCVSGVIRFWGSSHTLHELATTWLHTEAVSNLRTSRDGGFMLSGDWSGRLILWRTASVDGVFGPVSAESGFTSGALVVSSEVAKAAVPHESVPATAVPGGPQLQMECRREDRECFEKARRQMGLGQAVRLDRLLTAFGGDVLLSRSAEAPRLALAGCAPAALGEDQTCTELRLLLVDLRDGEQRQLPTSGFQGTVSELGFDRVGRFLAAASCHGPELLLDSHCEHSSLRVWDLRQPGELRARLERQGDFSAIAFAADSKTLAFGTCAQPGWVESLAICEGSEVRRLSLETGKPVGLTMPGFQGAIHTLAVGPEGGMIAAGRADGTIAIWDVTSAQLLGPPLVSPFSVVPLEFSGTLRLESGPADKKIVWTLDPRQWRERACQIANRSLTTVERRRYFGEASDRPVACVPRVGGTPALPGVTPH